MPRQLPFFPSLPHYSFSITLAEEDYVFNVRWNTRDEAWYLDLLEADETPIIRDMKVVLGAMIGSRSAIATRLPGTLIAFDTSGVGLEADLDSLGDRVQVFFLSAGELQELQD